MKRENLNTIFRLVFLMGRKILIIFRISRVDQEIKMTEQVRTGEVTLLRPGH